MSNWRNLTDELLGVRRRGLVAYAYHLTGSLPDAEDLVHDAVVRVLSRRHPTDDVTLTEEYVRRAIASRYIDIHRSHSSERRRMEYFAKSEAIETFAHGIEANIDLMNALAALTPRQRACVTLRYLADQSIAETASALRISDGAVKRYVSDAVVALGSILGVEPDDTDRVPVLKRRDVK